MLDALRARIPDWLKRNAWNTLDISEPFQQNRESNLRL
jgi:hypothetical protein